MSSGLFSMKGKICVITGGSRGLGKAIARGFLEAGAKRIYITARKQEECDQAAKELSEVTEQGECFAVAGDMSQGEEIARFAATLLEREAHVDVLVNNAGTSWLAAVEDFPEMGWDKVMNLDRF